MMGDLVTGKGIRLDLLLVGRGLFPSRNRAQRAIRAGYVSAEGVVISKPGVRVSPEASIRLLDTHRFVSRGGEKLQRAIEAFDLDVRGLNVIDGGASTGGFTDCLLQSGARSVCAVDVGHDQMAESLRDDPRVSVFEGMNLRHVTSADLPQSPFDMATLDVSFISVTQILPALIDLLRPGAQVIALVKPQFEAGPENVGRGGIVRDPVVHRQVLMRVMEEARRLGFVPCGLEPSPVAGGNLEFLLLLTVVPLEKRDREIMTSDQAGYLARCVERAHRGSCMGQGSER